MKKERLDKLLFDLNYFESKNKAAAAILAGNVKINEELITKAGFQIDPNKQLNIEIKSMPYVSRGGFKLQKAIETFNVEIKDRICFDAGASTGGFTDCLLQNEARKVYAVDVGYGQLAWKLRSDDRVKVIEKTNIRTCSFEDIYGQSHKKHDIINSRSHTDSEKLSDSKINSDTQINCNEIADLLVMDVSFISIEKVLPNLKTLLNHDFYEMICLIKPQFEAGKDIVDKGNGVVKDKSVHRDVINNVIAFAKNLGLFVNNLTYSSIKGPSGNIEYLVHLSTKDNNVNLSVEDVVNEAFFNLN